MENPARQFHNIFTLPTYLWLIGAFLFIVTQNGLGGFRSKAKKERFI